MEDYNKDEKAQNKVSAPAPAPDLTREERLELEEKAIQVLLDMGVKFSVPLKINPVNPPRRISWWNRHFPNHVKVWRDRRIPKGWNVSVEDMPDATLGTVKRMYVRHFHVKPLYLGTIDILRKLYLNIEYDEEKIEGQPIKESKKLFRYIPLMAEIAAVAIINNPAVADPLSKEVDELQKFLMEHLTVNRLKKLTDVISQMMNPAGFTSSIRSIREAGTTKAPTTQPKAELIEKEKS